jgi:type I restriction enzyme S subunit
MAVENLLQKTTKDGGNVDHAGAIIDHLDIWTAAIKTKSATGRGSSKKLELVGVKKLRELILELAVRGKLVPQDPNDEPANVLLEKVSTQKAQLIAEKKIKKQAIFPAIEDEETFSELPKGWVHCRLNELVYLLGDGLHGTPEYSDDGEYYFVNGNNLTNGKITIKPETKKVAQDQFDKYKKTLTDNTVLVSINGTLGNVAFYNNEKIVLGKSACYFNLANCISKLFIKRLIESPRFINYAFSKASGSTIKNLGLKAMNLHVIALPPLVEQHRIFAKVDELMALCDQLEAQTESSIDAHKTLVEMLLATLTDAKDADELNDNWQTISQHFDVLFTTQASIDQLKQTILQLAVMGKLVKQDPKDEPASKLLERIATEKQQLIKDGKIKKQKPLPPISDEEKPFELPEGWLFVNLSELFAVVTDGDHQAPPKAVEGVPFLVIGNLNTGKIILDDCRFVPETYYEKLDWSRKPSTGDILYTVTGSYGIPIKVNIDDPFCVQRHVAILKATDGSPIHYLSFLFRSKYAFEFAADIATGIAQKTVPLTGLRKMPISLPPIAEQTRIVAKLDELMALCDSLKAGLNQAQTAQLHLTDAIVEQAL